MQTTNHNINKLYQIYETMKFFPQTKDNYEMFSKFCIKKNFIDFDTHKIKGRRWDAALILSTLILSNKKICELGARDSILSSYLSGFAKEIHVSDNFDPLWPNLGTEEYWFDCWKKSAIFPKKLSPSMQDAKSTSYLNDYFDIVIGTSLLYRGITNGDLSILKEMLRICKPGGFIYLSIEMATVAENYSGTYFYSIPEFQYLLNHVSDSCKPVGNLEYDFNHHANNLSKIKNKYGICSGSLLLQKNSPGEVSDVPMFPVNIKPMDVPLLMADANGIALLLTDDMFNTIKNDSTENKDISIVHKITINNAQYAKNLVEVINKIKWSPININKVLISCNENIVTIEYCTNQKYISPGMYLCYASDNLIDSNIAKLQTDYLFAEISHPGTIINESLAINIIGSNNQIISNNFRIKIDKLGYLSAQGDPYISTIANEIYQLDEKTGFVNLYNNKELVINAHSKKYEPYKSHPLDYLQNAVFFQKTAIIILNKYGEIDQYLVVDNITLSICDQINISNETIFMSAINDTDPMYINRLSDIKQVKYDYRFAMVNVKSLGYITIRFVRYPDENLLTSIDILDNNSMLMANASGAFISQNSVKWVETILSTV